jgi:hypothetical protein
LTKLSRTRTRQAAVRFFTQLGNGVATNPIPNRGTGLSGTALTDLPPRVVPQYGATTKYLVPSYGQKAKLDSFAPIGLTAKGFRVPADWGKVQQAALQTGYLKGQRLLDEFIAGAAPGESTNYWGIVNNIVGTYPNNALGYLFRRWASWRAASPISRSTRFIRLRPTRLIRLRPTIP